MPRSRYILKNYTKTPPKTRLLHGKRYTQHRASYSSGSEAYEASKKLQKQGYQSHVVAHTYARAKLGIGRKVDYRHYYIYKHKRKTKKR